MSLLIVVSNNELIYYLPKILFTVLTISIINYDVGVDFHSLPQVMDILLLSFGKQSNIHPQESTMFSLMKSAVKLESNVIFYSKCFVLYLFELLKFELLIKFSVED